MGLGHLRRSTNIAREVLKQEPESSVLVVALALRSDLICQAYRAFDPDIVLVDHMPVGALGELKPMLDYAAEQGEDTRLFLGLRDVLDRPEVVRAVWNEVGAYDYLKLYEAVLVYSTPDLNDAPSAYGLAKHALQLRRHRA
jgi:predicted glycosyltransferase